ncbi:MAG: type II secretion system F family protein [Jatrophihabitans sp.]|uniref:type II secretion system F family protein n=1 Tax=Jatrophihabitans sp. TaxID=1932789 RepID=UPI003F7FC479
MPRFAYTATTLDGAPAKGVEKAGSRGEFELALYDRELRDIAIVEKKSILQLEISGPRVKREDLMHISRQLAAFVKAGLPILDAVHSVAAEAENSSVRRVMADIEARLRAGERFSDSLDAHADVFPEFYRGIVRSAELTGELDIVLLRLSNYIKRDLDARRKLKSATIYPAIVGVLAVVAIGVIGWWVLPKFKVFFAGLHADLPLPTRMLLAMTNFLTHWWWAILAVIAIIGISIFSATKTERGRYALDGFLLKVPVLGETIQYALVERFCRILASMVNAGVSLPEALRVATESLKNKVYIKSLDGVTEAMLEGQGLATPLARTALFPATAVQMLRVGEETGTLDTQLEVTAEFFETELDYKVTKLTSLFEPIIILTMGGGVGFVAVALVSAMYGAFNQVKV